MTEQNKTAVRRLFDELWNKGNLPVADELIAPAYTHHDASTPNSLASCLNLPKSRPPRGSLPDSLKKIGKPDLDPHTPCS
jgi:hypothetical protein